MTISEDMQNLAVETAELLKHLANPNRLRIVCRLLEGELSVGTIEDELNIRQPTLSRELGRLRDGGIITARRESKVVFYELTHADMSRLVRSICSAMMGGDAAESVVHKGTSTQKSVPEFLSRPKFMRRSAGKPGGYSQFATVQPAANTIKKETS